MSCVRGGLLSFDLNKNCEQLLIQSQNYGVINYPILKTYLSDSTLRLSTISIRGLLCSLRIF